MNAMVICSRNRRETGVLRESFTGLLSFHEAGQWRVGQAGTAEELPEQLREGDTVRICCVDVGGSAGMAEQARRAYGLAQMVLLVTASMSPTQYIRPGILPAGLLFQPVSQGEAQPLFRELLDLIRVQERQSAYADEVFRITSHGDTYRIPYSEILYFEARSKKLFLYTHSSEIEFYETLEHLLEQLPKTFLRCHKSFIVNTLAIEQVSLSRNLIVLDGGNVELPISRSCRDAVREAMR